MQRLGRYLIVERVGAGGMGVVYAAYDRQLDRRVALKVLRRDLEASGQLRLRQEARALAQLAHPNVVTIYDVDVLDDRLVLAMQYVEGVTLDRWLQQSEERSWGEILAAFVQAGEGLAAAHAAGIVHRDFKPSNVLIDAAGTVKVLDFGLAHSCAASSGGVETTAEHLPEASNATLLSLTCTGYVMGTPRYMAPEQHLGRPVDVRTDIFSFCVALYEALHGQHPFCEKAGRLLRNCVLEGRLLTPPPGRVPGAVWKVLQRGLQSDPNARWPAVRDLLDALRAAAEPRPKPWRKGVVFGGALVAMGLAAWQPEHAPCEALVQRSRDLWTPSTREAAARGFAQSPAGYGAHAWARVSRGIDDYVEQWTSARAALCEMDEVDPDARALAAVCLERRRHELDALIRLLTHPDERVIQNAVHAAGSLEPVAPCLELRFHDPYAVTTAADRAVTEALLADAARVRAQLVAGRYHEALEPAQTLVRRVRDEDQHRLAGRAHYLLGSVQAQLGDNEAALETLENAVSLAFASGDDAIAAEAATTIVYHLAQVLRRHDAAMRWAAQARALIARLEDRAALEGWLASAVGNALELQWQLQEARREYERAHALLRASEGAFSAKVARALNNLGNIHWRLDDLDEAERFYRRSYAVWTQTLGAAHPDAVMPLNNLATIAIKRDQPKVAEEALREVIEVWETSFGPHHPKVAIPLNNLALLLRNQGLHEQSLAVNERALEIRRAQLGDEHPAVAQSNAAIGFELLMLGRCEESVVHYERAIDIVERVVGPENEDIDAYLSNLALCRVELPEPEAALHYAKRSLMRREQRRGKDDPDNSASLHTLGVVQLKLGRTKEAADALARAVALRSKDPSDASILAGQRFDLARAWIADGRDRESALRWARQAKDGYLIDDDEEDADRVQAWIDARERSRS